MRQAPDGSWRLSSRLTQLFRFGFPVAWLAFLGATFVSAFAASYFLALLALAVFIAGLLWFRATAFQLCQVWADDSGLIVTRGRQRAVIPYAAIRDARQRHYFGFSEVLLHAPSPLGLVILFIPYVAQWFPYLAEHPADVFIQQRVAEATGQRGA